MATMPSIYTKILLMTLYISSSTLIGVGIDKIPQQPPVSYTENNDMSPQQISDAAQTTYQNEVVRSLGFKLSIIGAGIFILTTAVSIRLYYQRENEVSVTPIQAGVRPMTTDGFSLAV